MKAQKTYFEDIPYCSETERAFLRALIEKNNLDEDKLHYREHATIYSFNHVVKNIYKQILHTFFKEHEQVLQAMSPQVMKDIQEGKTYKHFLAVTNGLKSFIIFKDISIAQLFYINGYYTGDIVSESYLPPEKTLSYFLKHHKEENIIFPKRKLPSSQAINHGKL